MKMKKIFVVGLALASIFTLGINSAFAETNSETTGTEEANFNLIGGGLKLTTAPITTFGDITLEATPQTYKTNFENAFQVEDLRGTGEGWRLDVSASQFEVIEPEDGFAEGTSAMKLPVGSLSLSPLDSISRVGKGFGTLPKGNLTHNNLIDDGVVTVATANTGEGLGVFDLLYPMDGLSLVVDATTAKIDMVNYPDGKTPYMSVLTWDLVSAP